MKFSESFEISGIVDLLDLLGFSLYIVHAILPCSAFLKPSKIARKDSLKNLHLLDLVDLLDLL